MTEAAPMATPAYQGIGANGGPPMDQRAQIKYLATKLVEFRHDPLGFVMWAYPWGVPGSALQSESGPDEWQCEQLDEIGRRLRKNEKLNLDEVIREARASGHGIGKSAEVSWIIEWAIMTKMDTRGVVTANTDTQLRTKTWAELAKWHGMLNPMLQQMFKLTATAIYSTAPGKEKTWRIDAIPNSKTNPAGFAGLHNAGKRVLIIYDEASEIDDIIWDTSEGATTDANTEIIWCVYGNPTKPAGRFKEVMIGKLQHLWNSEQIDSRKVKRTNKATIAEWVKAWGEDSDFVRVRVRGMFPRTGTRQLISSEDVQNARRRDPGYIASDPLVAGLDVARFGDDRSVLVARRGRDARTIPKKEWRGIDTMELATQVAQWCREMKPDALFIDMGTFGAGVYDRLVQLRIPNVYGIDFGGASSTTEFNGVSVRVANPRAAMWVNMREWLKVGAIDDDAQLEEELTGVQYGLAGAESSVMLEPKEMLKDRIGRSPDHADALCLTFAMPIGPRKVPGFANPAIGVSTEYDLMKDVN